MSNYPPTPAFGGGFVMSRPPFPGKSNCSIRPQSQHPVSAPHFATRFPPLAEMTLSVSNVGLKHVNGNHLSVVQGVEGDREEGEVSDVEMENARWPSEKVDVQADGQLKARANGNAGNSNGKFVDESHETLSGSVDPRKAKSLTAQISALNLREQPWIVKQSNHTSHPNPHSPASYQDAQGHPSSFATPLTDLTSYGNTTVTNHTPQQMEEMRKKAQAAVLNLLPLKMTFKDIVDAGIHPSVLRQVFERIGLPIPLEEVAQNGDVSARLSQENRDKEIQKEKEREREREREEQVQRDREAKHLILQEKLRKQELILREQEEQRAKELARKLKEEQDRKEKEEREEKVREEAAKKKEEEERLQAEAARKKEEDSEQLRAKQRILQKLPAKPPLPAIPTPPFSSLPPRVTPAPPLPPPPFAPSTIASRTSIMIPGLLLDTMDMGPRAPETPMAAPVPVNIPPAIHETPQNGIVVASRNEDTIMKDVLDNRSFRKKRPVAADFDTEPSMKPQQPKRRFGSLKEGPLIFELTEDEDEDTEVDEPISNSSLKRQSSIRLPSQASKSPPAINGGAKPERNGKSPPARTSSAANGTTDAAKQLQDTEEKIRRLREEILARQEKKRKPSATATPTGTGTPVRVATPLEIPGLGSNSSLLLPLPSAQLLVPSPSKRSQPEKATRVEIPGIGAPSPDASIPSSSVATSVLEANTGTEQKQSMVTTESALVTEQSEVIQPSAHVLSPIPSGSQQKADEEDESQKMRDEAERLRMLLLSKRKVIELRQVKPLGIAKTGQISEAPANAEIIGKAQEAPPVPIAEVTDTNITVNNDNLNPSTTNERALDGIAQGVGGEVAREKSDLSPLDRMAPDITQEAPETVLISKTATGQPKLPLCQSPHSINQHPGEAATEGPESPPYEPSLENIRNGSDSPPYEPSLGFGDGVDDDLGDKMDIDVSDAEEGEILEESVDMEVDSGDDLMQDNLPTTLTISKGKTPELLDVKSMPWGTQGKDKSQSLISTTIQSTILPPKPHSPISVMVPALLSEERVNMPDPTVNTNDTTTPTAIPMSGMKAPPNVFTEYESPLRQFRSYRYHPQYLKMVEGGWRSLTFSNRIDPDRVFCVYEISGGKCNDTSCEKQHFRQIALSDDEILLELGSVMEGDTDTARDTYRRGLRELITDMRARKVNDFETVAAEITLYRSRSFNDTSRVVRLTKGP